jgi:hypothetical protein
MNNKFCLINSTSSIIVLLVVLFFSSCKNSDIGEIAVQPPGDKLHLIYTDSVAIKSYTLPYQALVITSANTMSIFKQISTVNLLGQYNDPVFGMSKASFYTQFQLRDSLIIGLKSLKDSLYQSYFKDFVVDSTVLNLGYYGIYGDNTSIEKVQAFELAESIDKNSAYTSSSAFSYNAIPLGQGNFTPHLNDSLKINGIKEVPSFKFKLNLENNFQNYIQQNKYAINYFVNFNGIYVQSTTVGNGTGFIGYFNLASPSTTISIYYHYVSHLLGKKNVFYKDSLVNDKHDLFVSGTNARVTNFSNSFTGTPFENALTHTDVGDSVLFLKSLGLSKIKVTLPHLTDFSNKGLIINKAELVFFVEAGSVSEKNFSPPARLELSRIGDNGENISIGDKEASFAIYGGIYNPVKGSYTFNITRHVQSILNGHYKNNGMYLGFGPEQVAGTAERVVLYGCKNSKNKIKLYLTYTKI